VKEVQRVKSGEQVPIPEENISRFQDMKGVDEGYNLGEKGLEEDSTGKRRKRQEALTSSVRYRFRRLRSRDHHPTTISSLATANDAEELVSFNSTPE
jgi:hypothetical protein